MPAQTDAIRRVAGARCPNQLAIVSVVSPAAQTDSARDDDAVERRRRLEGVLCLERDTGSRFKCFARDADEERFVAALPIVLLIVPRGCERLQWTRQIEGRHSVETEEADHFRRRIGEPFSERSS